MILPSDEIGISDILDFRECAQRTAFKMRRHTPLPERFQIFEGEKDEPPEAINWTNVYGSAVHDAIAIVERESVSDDAAIQRIWPEYQHWLDPNDLDLMRQDLETYHTRTQLGYRLVANERDMRVPLFVYQGDKVPEMKGRQIYFRFKVDALYQSMTNAGVFLTRDYKSSKWPKTEEEIHSDIQQWAYNFGLHEMYPEIESLTQLYDMLRFGVTPTHKNAVQRQQIKAWLIKQVTAIIEDDALKPRQNDWCYTCPILMDCRVTHMSAPYWKQRLAALAPERKDGRKIIVQLTDDDREFEQYTEIVPQMKSVMKMMERYVEAVEEAVRHMPADRQRELGATLAKPRTLKVFDADALRRVHAMHGDDFYQLVGITQKAVDEFFGADSPEAGAIKDLAGSRQTKPSIRWS